MGAAAATFENGSHESGGELELQSHTSHPVCYNSARNYPGFPSSTAIAAVDAQPQTIATGVLAVFVFVASFQEVISKSSSSTMKTFFLVAVVALFATFSSSASAETEQWTYKSNAADLFGPSDWVHVNAACAGKHQSPIDITVSQGKTYKQSTLPIQFSGKCPSYNIKQYWESFKAEAVNSTCSLAVNGKTHAFAQVHFHSPAEHTLKGKAYDAEAHFVHKTADGSIAVVGLFLQKKKNAPSDTFFSNFLCKLKGVNETTPVAATLGSFHAAVQTSLAKGSVFNYPGSLTTPGCTEPVDWWVIESPLVVSETEFNQIKAELKRIGAADNGKNARPTQPLNDRKVIVY